MGAYYPSLTSPKSTVPSPYIQGQKIASFQPSDLPDGMIYVNQPFNMALHPELLSRNSFSAHNCVEDLSVGRRDGMSLNPQNLDPLSLQPIGRQLNCTPAHSDCDTAAVDSQMFPQKILDVRSEDYQFQGLSLSLGTQMPSSVQTSSYQNHYTSPGLSSLLSFRDAEYLSFDFAGGSRVATIGAMRNHPQSSNNFKENPSSDWREPNGVSGNIYNSRYFKAAQDLLDEVVNVREALKQCSKSQNFDSLEEDVSKDPDLKSKMFSDPQSATKPPSELSSSELHDLRSKMTKLFSMLEEVDRKYKEYHQQIQILVSSFEIVAGRGAAKPYTALALQTISRQFRRIRDAIQTQIQVTQQCLGEEVETEKSQGGALPRLRFIDQKLRQQRVLQQFGIVRQPWRPQKGLPETAVSILRAWLFEHFLHPYPKDSEKIMLAKQTGLTRNQVANWFINARVRLWKPMIEDMYKEEFGYTEADCQNSPHGAQTAGTERSGSENKLDNVHNSSKCGVSAHDKHVSPHELESDADMYTGTTGLNFENGSEEVYETNSGLMKLKGVNKLNTAPDVGADEILSTVKIGNENSIPAAGSYDVSLMDCAVGNHVSLALGLQQGENVYESNTSGIQIKDYDSVSSSPDLTKEYCYMEPLNQQDRFANQHLFSDFIL